jgi:hypothetical protein
MQHMDTRIKYCSWPLSSLYSSSVHKSIHRSRYGLIDYRGAVNQREKNSSNIYVVFALQGCEVSANEYMYSLAETSLIERTLHRSVVYVGWEVKKGPFYGQCSCAHEAQINFGDLTLFLTYAFEEGAHGFCKDSIKIVVVHKVPL